MRSDRPKIEQYRLLYGKNTTLDGHDELTRLRVPGATVRLVVACRESHIDFLCFYLYQQDIAYMYAKKCTLVLPLLCLATPKSIIATPLSALASCRLQLPV